MKTGLRLVKVERVNPRQRCGETAELEMIFDGERLAALGVDGSDFLLDLLVSCAYGSFATALYEAVRHIDYLDFDPVSPSLDEIKRALRAGQEPTPCR